jgi:DtxR family transcriptional regulator, Mn-dependent transcriptional regulator
LLCFIKNNLISNKKLKEKRGQKQYPLKNKMKNSESSEMYLEVMYKLEERNGVIRSVDIAKELGYSKPSVSRAIGLLKTEEYILQEPYGKIVLSKKGRDKAKMIMERHNLLTEFLTKCLKLNANLAEQDACRIEHIVSIETMDAIKKYLETNH